MGFVVLFVEQMTAYDKRISDWSSDVCSSDRISLLWNFREDAMANKSNVPAVVPALGGEASLNRYLAEIRKFPLLTPEQEYMLAKRFQEHEDSEAAAKHVTSQHRLVAKIAMGYGVHGLPRLEAHKTQLQSL